jgi:nitroreductase
MDFETTVMKRASIRHFSNEKPGIMSLIEAINTANLAPSPGNLPILEYILIEDPEKISKIAEACQQNFISEAPFVVVVCSNSKKINLMYDTRSEKYVRQHAGAAIENFLLKITDMGFACCWIGAFSELIVKRLLGIPEAVVIEAILPVGCSIKKDKAKQKSKPALEGRIFFEHWGNKYKRPFRKVGET